MKRRAKRENYDTIAEMFTDAKMSEWVSQWFEDHPGLTLEEVCSWDEELQERDANMPQWRSKHDVDIAERNRRFSHVAVPRQQNVDDRRTVPTRDHPEYEQLAEQLRIQGGRPEGEEIPKAAPKARPSVEQLAKSKPRMPSSSWHASGNAWQGNASGNAWQGSSWSSGSWSSSQWMN